MASEEIPTPILTWNDRFVVTQATKLLDSLVAYEGQYKNAPPSEVQARIIRLSDFIEKKLSGKSK